MNARRLEEMFEECVTAYLDGRRSIEQSLSLYPSYAAELAPLLQTAIQLNDSFRRVNPPAQVQERGRQRFLADARARRQVRTMAGAAGRAGFFAGLFQRNYARMAAGAGAVAVIVAVGTAAALTGGSSGGGDDVAGNLPTAAQTERATPASVLSINQAITTINTRIQSGEPVRADDIKKLTQATTDLATAPRGEVEQAKEQVTQALTDADSLLTNIVATQPQVAPQAQQAQDTVRGVAGGLQIDIPSTTPPVVTATPVPGSQTATPHPTQATVTDTPAPTEAPTAEPTVEPTPSPTPVERGLPGGDGPS